MRTDVCCLIYVIKAAVTSFYCWYIALTLPDTSVGLLVTAAPSITIAAMQLFSLGLEGLEFAEFFA